jgi:hypothetical protein
VAQCDGQLMLINQNQALFSLLGTDVSAASRNIPKGNRSRTTEGPSWVRRGLEAT